MKGDEVRARHTCQVTFVVNEDYKDGTDRFWIYFTWKIVDTRQLHNPWYVEQIPLHLFTMG